MTYRQLTVDFKSIPRMYIKELAGVKPNTIRLMETLDIRKIVLDCWIEKKKYGKIEIKNSETNEYFTRKVTDVSIWSGWYIISFESTSSL